MSKMLCMNSTDELVCVCTWCYLQSACSLWPSDGCPAVTLR